MAYDERESILGEIYFALGAGAGALRIEGAAVQRLREELWKFMEPWPAAWDKQANDVLEHVRAIGRLAGHSALSEGKLKIGEEHLREAARKVIGISFTEVCGRLKDGGFLNLRP